MFSLNANEFHIFLARWRKWVEWNHLDNFRLQATQSFQPASDVSFQPRISNVFSSEQSVKACAHQQYPIIPKNCHKTRSKLLCITNHNKSPETYVCICYNLYNAKHTHTYHIYMYIYPYVHIMPALCIWDDVSSALLQCSDASLSSQKRPMHGLRWEPHSCGEEAAASNTFDRSCWKHHRKRRKQPQAARNVMVDTWWWIL